MSTFRFCLRNLTLPLSIFITCPSYAEGNANGHVRVIQSYSGHSGLLVQIGASQINPDQCLTAGWYIYPDDSPRVQFVQGALLAAQMSGKDIQVTVKGCYEGYPKIVHVTLPQ